MNNSSLIKFISSFNNAQTANLEKFSIGKSSVLNKILDLLSINGFIIGSSLNNQVCNIYLKHSLNKKFKLKIISKSGKKIYMSYKDIEKSFLNTDFVLISSSFGIITNKEALLLKIGGEIILKVE